MSIRMFQCSMIVISNESQSISRVFEILIFHNYEINCSLQINKKLDLSFGAVTYRCNPDKLILAVRI